jgi:phosphatidylserine decarboxylase
MVRDAYIFAVPVFALALACAVPGFWWGAALLFAAGCFVCYFFRNPRRRIPDGDRLIVSPADGRIVRVTPPRDGAGQHISIFMSLFDVHVNRAPVAGVLERLEYRRGRFKAAFRHEASEVNEQNILTIRHRDSRLVVRQVAGILARRVVCWKKPGQNLDRGEPIGLIRFGSRVDILLPTDAQALVKEGDRVRGGSSIVGEFIPPG